MRAFDPDRRHARTRAGLVFDPIAGYLRAERRFKRAKAPKAPNPVTVAAAQTKSNIDTARVNAALNRVDQYTPYGSETFTALPGDRWRSDVTLSPEAQRAVNSEIGFTADSNQAARNQLGYAAALLGQPLSFAGAPAMPTYSGAERAGPVQTASPTFADAGPIQRSVGPNDFSADRQRVEDAIFSRLSPQFDRDRAGLEASLANQGIAVGSEAYNRAVDELNRSKTDARMQAVLAGGQEQSRLFGMDLQKGQFANSAEAQAYAQALGRGQFANAAVAQNNDAALAEANQHNQALGQDVTSGLNLRQQYIQELLQQRETPLEETAKLFGIAHPNVPNFGPTPTTNVQPTDVTGAAYNSYGGQVNAYNAQQQRQGQTMGGVFSALGSLGGAALF